MANIEEIFAPRTLMGMVSLFGMEGNTPVTDWFRNGRRKDVVGNAVDWDREDFSRSLGPFGSQKAPAIRLFPQDRDNIHIPLAHIRMERTLLAQEIMIERRGLGELVPNAEQEVARAVRDLVQRGQRSIEFVCSELLFNQTGATINSTTVPGSQVTWTLDFGTGDFDAAAAWSTIGTNILSSTELFAAMDQLTQNSGLEAGRAVHNRTVQDYLVLNTQVQSWFQTVPTAPQIVSGDQLAAQVAGATPFNMAGGLGGIPSWIRLDHGYVPDGGSFTKFLSTDFTILLPTSDDILGFAEGHQVIPTEIIGGENLGSVATLSDAAGPVVYAVLQPDPVAVKLVYAHSFIPTIFVPEAVVIIDTTP